MCMEYLAGLMAKKIQIVVGLILIFAALLVTGSTFKETEGLSTDIMIASFVALAIGVILIVRGGRS